MKANKDRCPECNSGYPCYSTGAPCLILANNPNKSFHNKMNPMERILTIACMGILSVLLAIAFARFNQCGWAGIFLECHIIKTECRQ